MSFCVAGVARRDIPTCFMTCQKWFCVAGALLLRGFQKIHWIFRGRRSTPTSFLRGRRSTFNVSCCLCFANRNVRGARLGDTRHPALYTLHSTFTLHTLFTLYIYNLNSTLHTLHLTPHFQLYTQPLHTPHFPLHTLHLTHYTPHLILNT